MSVRSATRFAMPATISYASAKFLPIGNNIAPIGNNIMHGGRT